MGCSRSKHCVSHIILWQSPAAAISSGSRCSSWANFLIHFTGGCQTGYVSAKLTACPVISTAFIIHEVNTSLLFFKTLALCLMWTNWSRAPQFALQIANQSFAVLRMHFEQVEPKEAPVLFAIFKTNAPWKLQQAEKEYWIKDFYYDLMAPFW